MQEINSLYLSNVNIRKQVFNDLNLKSINMEKLTNKEIETLITRLQNDNEYWESWKGLKTQKSELVQSKILKNNAIIQKLQNMRTNEGTIVCYRWVAESNDGAFTNESVQIFSTKKECYDDMRNAVLEKMKWNTQFDEDFYDLEEDDYIGYEVRFQQDKIIHKSYSGTYTYEIKKIIFKKMN